MSEGDVLLEMFLWIAGLGFFIALAQALEVLPELIFRARELRPGRPNPERGER